MSAADPNAELWFTRHQQALDPALKARDARLRHSVTRDVAAACVEARTTAEWRVDTGKTIARHRIDNLASPRLPTEPEWPASTPGEEALQLQRANANAARLASKQQREAERKREEVRRWRQQKDAEKAAKRIDGRSPRAGSPRHAAQLREAGQRGLQAYVEKQAARQQRAKELPRGTWVVRERVRREVKELPEAGPGFREVLPEPEPQPVEEPKATEPVADTGTEGSVQ